MKTIFCCLAIFAVSLVTAQTTSSCQDIDTSACQLMAAQRPDMCSDPSLSKAACPRFCKLCPVECFHCNATVLDFHLCNTTMACLDGQVCMRKELKSFVDGHHEYQMTCEDKQLCDGGSDLSIPFGKRNIESRDISITCCAEDFCNYPGSRTTISPTTTGVIGVTIATAQTRPACDDIDTAACQLLISQRPDLCSDIPLAKSTCPRFCKLCPVECYHCNATVLDYHQCNTTILCADGEVCMRKELKSYLDGHHEYEMTCEDKQVCDGGGDFKIPFGKRNIVTRDISITCCVDDLCNYPTSSSGCPKDIVFLVDGASHVVKTEEFSILNLILAVVKRLDIGMTDNLVALYGYDQSVHEKIGLQQYTDEASLFSSLQYQKLAGTDRSSDTEDAIHFLINQVLTAKSGDRLSYPDAVVIITDSAAAQRVHLGLQDQTQLQGASNDVILISVGPRHSSWGGTGTSGESSIATDENHVLHVENLNALLNLVDKLSALLLKC